MLGDFRIEVDPKYFKDKIKNNKTTFCLFQSIQYYLEEYDEDYERNTFSDLICILKEFKLKYTLAMGTVVLSVADDNQIVLKGYLKPNFVKAIAPFHPILEYSSNNEEYYRFNIKKLYSITNLLNKHNVSFVNQTILEEK